MRVPELMRAVRMHEAGGPEVLRLEEVPVPRPVAGQALVRVEAAGLNFIETYQRSGQYPVQLPATLGSEGAGVVVALGDGAGDVVAEGQRVAWAMGSGAYAEYVVMDAARLVPVPDGVSTRQAAALMLQGMTAHYLTTSTRPLHEGDSCLVHAAAGGVGLLLVQLARRRGAYVIGTAGSEEKADLAREAGAHDVVIYTKQDFADEVRRITDGRGVDVIYDSVGRDTFLQGLGVLARRGMMVLYGQASGAVEPLDPQLLNRHGSVYLTRPSLAHYTADRDELLWRSGELFRLVESGDLKLRIGAEYALADVAEAHRALEGRRTTGKVLISVTG